MSQDEKEIKQLWRALTINSCVTLFLFGMVVALFVMVLR